MARLILDPRERRLSVDDTLRPNLVFGVLKKDILQGVDFSSDPKLQEVLLSICSEIHYITNTLISENNFVNAFSFMTIIARTLREVLDTRGEEIREAIQKLKDHQIISECKVLGIEARETSLKAKALGPILRLKRLIRDATNQ